MIVFRFCIRQTKEALRGMAQATLLDATRLERLMADELAEVIQKYLAGRAKRIKGASLQSVRKKMKRNP